MELLCFILIHSLLILTTSLSAELPLVNTIRKLTQESKINQSSSLSEGLLSTDFRKNLHAYIRDMEERSDMKLTPEQKSKLKRALKGESFKKLAPNAYNRHKINYNESRSRLILEWEKNIGRAWPKSLSRSWKTGQIEMFNHQFHHIIPQELGGPNAWWNGHPLKAGKDHHGGVHKKNSPLNKIIDQWVSKNNE